MHSKPRKKEDIFECSAVAYAVIHVVCPYFSTTRVDIVIRRQRAVQHSTVGPTSCEEAVWGMQPARVLSWQQSDIASEQSRTPQAALAVVAVKLASRRRAIENSQSRCRSHKNSRIVCLAREWHVSLVFVRTSLGDAGVSLH